MKDEEVVATVLGGAIATVLVPVLAVCLAMWAAWPLWALWGWFLVPLGLPAVTYFHAIGLMLLVILVSQPDRKRDWWQVIISPPLIVFVGYLAHWAGGMA